MRGFEELSTAVRQRCGLGGVNPNSLGFDDSLDDFLNDSVDDKGALVKGGGVGKTEERCGEREEGCGLHTDSVELTVCRVGS